MADLAVTCSFFLISGVTSGLGNFFLSNKTAYPSSASLKYRSRTPGVGSAHLIMESTTEAYTGRPTAPTAHKRSSTTINPAFSPEEMLKQLLLQAGVGNVSIQLPVVSMTEAPQFTPTKPTSVASASTVVPVTQSTTSITFSTTAAVATATSLPIKQSIEQSIEIAPGISATQSTNQPNVPTTAVISDTRSTAVPTAFATSTAQSPTTESANDTRADVLKIAQIGALGSLVIDGTTKPSTSGNSSGNSSIPLPVTPPLGAMGRTATSLSENGFNVLPSGTKEK